MAISAKVGSVLSFGTGAAQALSHFRWQVTALRLPWVLPNMGSRWSVGGGVIRASEVWSATMRSCCRAVSGR